jgi:hypothetical protein
MNTETYNFNCFVEFPWINKEICTHVPGICTSLFQSMVSCGRSRIHIFFLLNEWHVRTCVHTWSWNQNQSKIAVQFNVWMIWRVDHVMNFVLVTWMPVALKFVPESALKSAHRRAEFRLGYHCTDVPESAHDNGTPKHNGGWPRNGNNSGTQLKHSRITYRGPKCRRGTRKYSLLPFKDANVACTCCPQKDASIAGLYHIISVC